MKRRHFIAAAAAALFGSREALAAPARKPAAKPARAAARPARPVRNATRPNTPPAVETAARMPASEPPPEPPELWRAYELTTEISLPVVRGAARVWVPLPLVRDTGWQRALGHSWKGNFSGAGIQRDPTAGLEVFHAEWKDAAEAPRLELVSRVSTLDRHFDITRRASFTERSDVLRRNLRSTEHVPLNAAMLAQADRIVGRIKDPLAQGKAIYDWVIDNVGFDATQTYRGDIAAMLAERHPFGNSTEIALLFVGLCRAAGLPARPVSGLRVDTSGLLPSLGASGDLAQAQHCRAEFYAAGYGWIPVDPADVKRAAVAEPQAVGNGKYAMLRKVLFGFWEMNWVALNVASEVILENSGGQPLPYFNQPLAETAEGRIESPDNQRLAVSIRARRLAA